MVRKRSKLDIDENQSKKTRSVSQKEMDFAKKRVNLLNDSLLSLYKGEQAENSFKNDPETPQKNIFDDPAEDEGIKFAGEDTSKTPLKKPKITLKKKPLSITPKQSKVTFADVGGLDDTLIYVSRMFMHLKDPTLFEDLGVRPVRGLLLHGPPGCGKTHLVHAIAGEMKLPLIEVAATELVCGISGESESRIRDLFDETLRSVPCILFIDEIDAACPKRETTDRGMERRIVAQLLKCLDELNEKDALSQAIVIGATNRPDSIDTALRRGGRFDHEIGIGMPDENARLEILLVLCSKLKLASDFDLHWLARNTPGYVGADLKTVITEAVEIGLWRIYKHLVKSASEKSETKIKNSTVALDVALEDGKLESEKSETENINSTATSNITLADVKAWLASDFKVPEEEKKKLFFELHDFRTAIHNCIPYSKREGFATVPDVTWDDVGALENVKKQLQAAILWPVKHRELYENSNMSSTKGVLLCGPKGCGKTLLAKAIANECSINFLSVKGPELLSMYLGESEKAVRQCFQRARSSAPCVIFFDEIDALCPPRSGSNVNAAAERVVNQLLTEMDGMEERKQVFVIAATNRPEKIDSAMLRPGRLEEIIYIDIPSPEGRVDILKSITKNKTRPKIADDVDLETIGNDPHCEGFSGADLAYLVRKAFCLAIEDCIESEPPNKVVTVCLKHFEQAFSVVKPSVKEWDRKKFRGIT